LSIVEIVVLLALALIVLGPEQLPEVLKTAGKVLHELRSASNTLLRELTDVMEEPRRTLRELDPLKPEDKPAEPPREP
jgi:Sec-independent protein translocase protein TatA